jgi:hypothetical protein
MAAPWERTRSVTRASGIPFRFIASPTNFKAADLSRIFRDEAFEAFDFMIDRARDSASFHSSSQTPRRPDDCAGNVRLHVALKIKFVYQKSF